MSQDNPTPNVVEIGYGATVVNSSRFHQQGNLNETSNATDIAIVGDGFFQVSLPDGSTGYTRDGALGLSAEGSLITSSGYMLDPQIVIPAETVSLVVSKDGSVYGYMPQETEPQLIGQITIAKFINPSGLSSMGENLFTNLLLPEKQLYLFRGKGTGYLKQGLFLEGSKVSAVEV
jgi:flagellar basal-body rod protein FlgG